MLPSLGAPGPPHIVVAIDTSGSMSADRLSTILAEVDTMRSVTETQLTLIDCDAAIRNAVTYEPWELTEIDLGRHTFKGRGGTDFRPVFEWIEGTAERGLAQPDALVYMTDGIGQFPARPPSFPTRLKPWAGSSPKQSASQ